MPMIHARYVFFIALISLNALLVGCSQPESQVSLSRDAVIVAFGDSLTQGVGTTRENSYPLVLQQQLGVSVINEGVSGETSAQGLDRLEEMLETHHPQLVIVCFGGNDILQRKSVSQLEANLEQMVTVIESYGAHVMLVAVPEIALLPRPLPLYASIAERHELVADLTTLSDLLKQRSMKSDTVHLNAKGYAALASALSQRIVIQ